MPAEFRPDRLAVLIDAENIHGGISILDDLLSKTAQLGVAHVMRAYGDFASDSLKCWGAALSSRGIEAIQQFKNQNSKNASDIALVIDAMDLLYSRRYDVFCIASSDSDFTRLASRIRADGARVYGFGGTQPAASLVAVCDGFLELKPPQNGVGTNAADTAKAAGNAKSIPSKLLLRIAKRANADGTWAPLSTIGKLLREERPDFNYSDYGKKKLRDLLEASGEFQIKGEGSAARARISSKT